MLSGPRWRQRSAPELTSHAERKTSMALGKELIPIAQCFHQKGIDELEGGHNVMESNLLEADEARDPDVDGGGLINLVGLTNNTTIRIPH